jgi:hypothetical protein
LDKRRAEYRTGGRQNVDRVTNIDKRKAENNTGGFQNIREGDVRILDGKMAQY